MWLPLHGLGVHSATERPNHLPLTPNAGGHSYQNDPHHDPNRELKAQCCNGNVRASCFSRSGVARGQDVAISGMARGTNQVVGGGACEAVVST